MTRSTGVVTGARITQICAAARRQGPVREAGLMSAVIILQPEQRGVMGQALADAVRSYTRQ